MKTKNTINTVIPDALQKAAHDLHYWNMQAMEKELEDIQAQKERIAVQISTSETGIATAEQRDTLEALSRREASIKHQRNEIVLALRADDRFPISPETLEEMRNIRFESDLDYSIDLE